MKSSTAIHRVPLLTAMALCAYCATHPHAGKRPSLDHAEDFNMAGYSSEPEDFIGVMFKSGEPSHAQHPTCRSCGTGPDESFGST